jgi:hypothetical protein
MREVRACGRHDCACELMVCQSRLAASSQFTGLMRTASKSLVASIARVQRSRRPVHAMSAVCLVAGSARKASATTNPSIPGMRRSHKTASGTSCVARNTPRKPPFARSTQNPCASSAACALSRKSASSSTISTRGSALRVVPASLALSDIPFPPRRCSCVDAPLVRRAKYCFEPDWRMRNVQIVGDASVKNSHKFPFFASLAFFRKKSLGFVRRVFATIPIRHWLDPHPCSR